MIETDSCSGDPEIQQKKLNKKLIEASKAGDHQGVSRALEEGAEITYRGRDGDNLGDTGLHQGTMYGHDKVVRIFLEKGIDVNIRDGAGSKATALMNAAVWNKISCLKILLENGANPDLKDGHHGWTALMTAARNNYSDIVGELLKWKADDMLRNNQGQTVLQLAEENGIKDVVRILKSFRNKEKQNQEVLEAAGEGKWRLVYGLIAAGADMETRNKYNMTCLHISTEKKRERVVRLLLQLGIDVNIKGEDCSTSLLIAARAGHQRIVKILIQNGADINLRDHWGSSALMEAAINGHTNIVCELLEAGADRENKNNSKKTAFELAQSMKKHDIAIILI